MAKTSVSLGPIQETLLIPLLGRARETRQGRGLIDDPRAVEIVDQLDYDFSKWDKSRSLMGATVRTRMFDDDVQSFLKEHPDGTVVEIGCGLNTRYERLDNGRARWFDLDLPDVIDLRRRYFQDTDRRTMLAASVLDQEWMDTVAATGGPYCFVSEAVLIYLDAADGERVIERIAARFPESRIVMDTTPQSMVKNQARHDAMKYLPKASWFRWACDDPRDLERFGLRLIRSRSMLDIGLELRRLMPWPIRLMLKMPWLWPSDVRKYGINLYVTLPAESGAAPDPART